MNLENGMILAGERTNWGWYDDDPDSGDHDDDFLDYLYRTDFEAYERYLNEYEEELA